MASPLNDSNMQVMIQDFPSKSLAFLATKPTIWHPLEHLNGHVTVRSTGDFDLEKISISLQGHSRVWIESLKEDGKELIREVSSYKFLHQSHDIVGIQCNKDVATRSSGCVADFSLLIPRWAILKVDQVPDQCLNLPPSMSLGQPYKVSEEQCEYGQPNIEYQLVARITFRRSADNSGRPGQPEVQSASKTITIMPCSLPSPPTDLGDFPEEFISSESNTYNALFSGTSYTMKLSTSEPAAVGLQPPADNPIMVPVNVMISCGSNKGNTSKIMGLPGKLKNLIFKVQPILRAKTFYSTVPFRKMPCQTMLTAKGTLRLKDEVLKLASHNLSVSSWEHILEKAQGICTEIATDATRPSSSHEMPNAWSTFIKVPISVRNDLVPTFCTATAARQYSLILRIIVGGWKFDGFVLEVPLQIVHSQKNALGKSGPIVDEQPPAFEPISTLLEPWRMSLEDAGEPIPGYS